MIMTKITIMMMMITTIIGMPVIRWLHPPFV